MGNLWWNGNYNWVRIVWESLSWVAPHTDQRHQSVMLWSLRLWSRRICAAHYPNGFRRMLVFAARGLPTVSQSNVIMVIYQTELRLAGREPLQRKEARCEFRSRESGRVDFCTVVCLDSVVFRSLKTVCNTLLSAVLPLTFLEIFSQVLCRRTHKRQLLM